MEFNRKLWWRYFELYEAQALFCVYKSFSTAFILLLNPRSFHFHQCFYMWHVVFELTTRKCSAGNLVNGGQTKKEEWNFRTFLASLSILIVDLITEHGKQTKSKLKDVHLKICLKLNNLSLKHVLQYQIPMLSLSLIVYKCPFLLVYR